MSTQPAGVPLADVIAALDAAYPPHLAHDWDSVGLVCGDPDEPVDNGNNTVVNPRGTDKVPLLIRVGDTDRNDLRMGDLVVVVGDGDYCHGASLVNKCY